MSMTPLGTCGTLVLTVYAKSFFFVLSVIPLFFICVRGSGKIEPREMAVKREGERERSGIYNSAHHRVFSLWETLVCLFFSPSGLAFWVKNSWLVGIWELFFRSEKRETGHEKWYQRGGIDEQR